MKKFALLAVLAVVALVGGSQAVAAPSKSKKCTPHKVAYVVHGTLVSGSVTKNSDGKTYSGTLTVHITKADKHAKSQKGTDQTYAFSKAHGTLGKGEDPSNLTAGSKTTVKGKITQLSKKCNQSGFTPTVTVTKFTVKEPKKHK